jgi:hypothetical protein
MKHSAEDKDVNTEPEEAMTMKAVTKQRLVKTTADRENLMQAVVNCSVCEFSTAL